ncbi:hypothetical protein, partial [Burkholderia sp. SIMBA_024]|uniref:hypothetical protein n=1 Tax=Burkholderia sp. SIMBA_024 TaxID=3085768 RepID=UPI0039785157
MCNVRTDQSRQFGNLGFVDFDKLLKSDRATPADLPGPAEAGLFFGPRDRIARDSLFIKKFRPNARQYSNLST